MKAFKNTHIRLNRNQRRIAAAFMLVSFLPTAALALPVAPQVVSGSAAITTNGSAMTVTNSANAIINWQGFSIGQGESTRFIQPSAASAVLNRITGGDPSRILGALQSNGKVLLINPNGILFGPDSRVDVNGLVASSLNISNQDFLAGRMNFSAGLVAGKVENQGTIATPGGGQVYLIAPDVANSGIITAPNGDILLAAGKEVLLVDKNNPEIAMVVSAPEHQAVNLGNLAADAGRIGVYGGIVRQKGRISADSAVKDASGRIFLKATREATVEAGSTTTANGAKGGSVTVQASEGTTLISGTIETKGSEGSGGTVQLLGRHVGLIDTAAVDASGQTGGGTVLVGGDYQGRNSDVQNAEATYMGKDAVIKADATDSSNGGKVILWSDNATRAYGSISARGGITGGNGGFVETSGHYLAVDGIRVTTTAPKGKNGQWLLDPDDVVITNATSGNATSSAPNPIVWTSNDGNPSTIDAGIIQNGLTGNDVTIQTTTGGTITVSSPITWSSAHELDLVTATAGTGGIAINAAITASDANATLYLRPYKGDLTQTSAGIITVPNLFAYADSGAVKLGTATNMVGTLSGYSGLTSGSGFSLKNGQALTVDTTAGSYGVVTGGADIVLTTTAGDLIVKDAIYGVKSGTGTATLTSAGAISDNGGTGIITAGTLSLASANGISLTNSANAIKSFSANNSTAGDIALNNTAAPLTINGLNVSNNGTGNISITNTGAINAVGWIQTAGNGNISLTATGGTATIGNSLLAGADAGTGTVNVTATGAGSDILLNTINVYSGATGGGSGNISMTAGRIIALNPAELKTAGNLTLTAGGTITETGAGAIHGALLTTTSVGGTNLPNANVVTSFNATNSGSGDILLENTAAPLSITGVSQSGGGGVNVFNNGSISTSGTMTLSGGMALFTADGATSDITVNGAISKTTGSDAALTLLAQRNIEVKQPVVSTSGKMNVNLVSHYLNDSAPGSISIQDNITTNGGSLLVGGGTNPSVIPAIGYDATTLGGNRQYGVNLDNTFGTALIDTAGGNVSIRGQGVANSSYDSLGIYLGSAQIHANGGNILLDGKSGVNPVSLDNAGVYITDVIDTTGTGTITIQGSGGANTSATTRNRGVFVTTTAATIRTANGALSLTGAGGINTTNPSNPNNQGVLVNSGIVQSTGSSVTIIGSAGDGGSSAITNNKTIDGYSGVILDAGTGTFSQTVSTAITKSSGPSSTIDIKADSINLGNPTSINAGATGEVIIESATPGWAIQVDSTRTAGTLGLLSSDFAQITAGNVQLGSANTGGIFINANISKPGTSLSLIGNSSIGGPGTLTANSLAANASTGINLTGSNVVPTVNLTNSTSGDVRYRSNIGAGSTLNVSGNNTGTGGFFWIDQTSGNINVASPGIGANGLACLSTSGNITQVGLISSTSLHASSGGSVTLLEANPVGVIAGDSTGDFSYRSTNLLTLSNISDTTMTLNAHGILSGGNITLVSDSALGINQSAGAKITASGLKVSTTGNVDLADPGNNVGALTAVGVGGINFNNFGALTVGVSGNGVTTTTNQPINITAGGSMVVSAPVTAGVGSLGTVSLSGVGVTNNSTITGPGGVTINAGTGTLSNAAGVIETGASGIGPINLIADSMTLAGGTIVSSVKGTGKNQGMVYLSASSTGRAINLGSTEANTLSLLGPDMQAITAAYALGVGGTPCTGPSGTGSCIALTNTGGITVAGEILSTDLSGIGANGWGFLLVNGANGSINVNAGLTSPVSVSILASTLSGTVTVGAPLTATAGNVSTHGASIINNSTITASQGVNLTADTMSLVGGTISAGGASGVRLTTQTAGRPISLGSTEAGALSLLGTDLQTITTSGGLHIGDTTNSTGGITVAGPITADNLTGVTGAFSLENKTGPITVNAGLTSPVSVKLNTGGNITVNNGCVSASSGSATLTAAGGIAINASTADAFIMAPDVYLNLGGDLAFTASGSYKPYVSATLPTTTHLTFTNSTGKVLFNGIQTSDTTSGDMGFFSGGPPGAGGSPAVAGSSLILSGGDAHNLVVAASPSQSPPPPPPPPTVAQCTADPALPGCSNILPSLDVCTTTPTAPGCSAVLPTLSVCTTTPTALGCSAVLPTLALCTTTPDAPGCKAVLPSLDSCTTNPASLGCSAVLPTLSICTTTPTAPGCSAVLPTLALCTATPNAPGCKAVLPSLDSCTTNPASSGCSAVLPTLTTCTTTPTAPGCTAVLPAIATCTTTPTAPGCKAVLPSLDSCVTNPASSGCSVVLPTLSACTTAPTAPGCSAVLPPLSVCTTTPTAPGCSAVLPTLATCTNTPAAPGCTAVLPSLSICTTTPTAAGCTAVLPSLATCTTTPSAPGCTAVLPSLSICMTTPTAPGCVTVLPTLSTCTTTPSAPGCSAVLPTLANCMTTPTASGCTAVLPSVATCAANPAAPGCTAVLPSLSICTTNPATLGCSAVLPTIDACMANSTLPGCSDVLPSLAACAANSETPGCRKVLPPTVGSVSGGGGGSPPQIVKETVPNTNPVAPIGPIVFLAKPASESPPPAPVPSPVPSDSSPSKTVTQAGADSPPAQTVTQSGDSGLKEQNGAGNKDAAGSGKDNGGKDKDKNGKDKDKEDKDKNKDSQEQQAASGDKKDAKPKKTYCN